jgi:hypothetical protein
MKTKKRTRTKEDYKVNKDDTAFRTKEDYNVFFYASMRLYIAL